jgi:protein PET100
MYIMFPIGWMYYFGTNLDNKFSVKDFWPTKEQLNRIPTEREDIQEELERMKKRRLQKRELRLEDGGMEGHDAAIRIPVRRGLTGNGPLDQIGDNVASAVEREGKGWMEWATGR